MQLFLQIPRVARAFEFAVQAHAGQKYADLPYFTHPLAVAEELVKRFPDADQDTIIIALLHDVVEDTDVTLDMIREMFGDAVARGVELVTKDNSKDYQQNIDHIIVSAFRPAIMVKWADNRVTMTGDKSDMDEERRTRLNNKYAISFVKLSNALGV